jgi:hypothetical protein
LYRWAHWYHVDRFESDAARLFGLKSKQNIDPLVITRDCAAIVKVIDADGLDVGNEWDSVVVTVDCDELPQYWVLEAMQRTSVSPSTDA